MKNRKLREAIENVGMVNNIDEQNFDKDFKGVAPVSYADAVLRARAKRDAAKESCEKHRKVAEEALKKEISNAEHPEPLDKIKVNEEGKMTLDEGLFESFDDEHLGHGDDVCLKCGKNPCECKIEESLEDEKLDFNSTKDILKKHLIKIPRGAMSRSNIKDVLVAYCGYSNKDANDFVSKFGVSGVRNLIEESLYPEYVSYQGKKMRVQGIRPDGKYALSEPKYSGLDITNHPEYLIDVDKDEVEALGECVHTEIKEGSEEKKIYRVTYKHSPEVFSSVMVKAANEDEAKQKLAVKEPGKDIVGVSVMSDDEVNDMTNRGMSLMEAKVVDDFSSYEPWEGAIDTFDAIQAADKLDELEQLIDDMYPDGINRTELNDLLWFEADWVYSMLDMSNPAAEEDDVEEEE